MAPLTTMAVGGPARYFVEAATTVEVGEAIAWARARRIPLFVLGGGSNLLVADSGFPGLVLKVALKGVSHSELDGKMLFTAAAGEDWDTFVGRTVARNCAGIECLSGIPGTVGAAPVQNIGAYGQEAAETICQVDALDLETMATTQFAANQCEFAYRTSIFNSSCCGRYIILKVTFSLTPGGDPKVAYADLKNCFAGRAPSLQEAREAVRSIRRGKGMLMVEGDENCRSAGSFFKNPILSPEHLGALQRRLAARNLAIPSYSALEQQHKVSAAWLVEQAGFSKGYRHGRVGISGKHALAIVNRGGATATEVVALANAIRRTVRKQFGVDLQPEPVMLGFRDFIVPTWAAPQSRTS